MQGGLRLDIPGFKALKLEHLLLDLNGTLALDGALLPGVAQAVELLGRVLRCHLVTADTFGTAASLFNDGVELELIQKGNEAAQKLNIVNSLGPQSVAALGNGANDALMLQAAAVSVCILGREGASPQAILAADVVTPGPLEALELFLHPDRLRATLRR